MARNQTFRGRDVVVSYSLDTTSTPPVSFTLLGAVRTNPETYAVETVDVTTGSSGAYRERLAMLTAMDGSIAGVATRNTADNMAALRDYIRSDEDKTGWLEFRTPCEGAQVLVDKIPVVFTSFDFDNNSFDAEVTWSIGYESDGEPEFSKE